MKYSREHIKRIETDKRIKDAIKFISIIRAKLSVVGPKVEAVYSDTLKSFEFYNDRSGERISDYNLLYTTDQDTSAYYEQARALMVSRGLQEESQRELCPKLELEYDIIKAEQEILEAVRDILELPAVHDLKASKGLVSLAIDIQTKGVKYE